MKKLKKKTKKPTITKLKGKAWDIYSIYIRMRDCLRTVGNFEYGKCISCGRVYPFKKLQAGHFIQGRYSENLFYERGTHAQCYHCNIGLKGNVVEYMIAIEKLYGKGIVEELRENNKKAKHFKPYELEDIMRLYTDKIEGLRDGRR